jgi:hypothetical protein
MFDGVVTTTPIGQAASSIASPLVRDATAAALRAISCRSAARAAKSRTT